MTNTAFADPVRYTAGGGTGISRILSAENRSFSMLPWMSGKALNDSEFNLLQQMYNARLSEIGQQASREGFTTKGALDFSGSAVPGSAFKVSPSALLALGHIARVGNPDASGEKAQITLAAANPGSGTRVDLVFLEFWFAEVEETPSADASDKSIYKNGGADLATYTNDIRDSTLALESTRRVQLRWRHREVADVGGATNVTLITNSLVLGRGDAASAQATKTFTQMTNSVGTATNLYRAGNGDTTDAAAFKTTDGYVYGVPCFQVTRTAGGTALISGNVVDVRPTGGSTFSVVSPLTLTANFDTETPLTLVAHSGTQSADLLAVQNSALSTIAAVNSAGAFKSLVNGSTGGLIGGVTGDVNLYRSAADTWRTNDALTIDGVLTVSARASIAPTAPAGITNPSSFTITAPTYSGNLAASTEFYDAQFNLSRTVTFATGALALQRAVLFQPPTYAFAGASTLAVASTVSITGAPVAGSNATLTNTYGLMVEGSAAVKLTGLLSVGGDYSTDEQVGLRGSFQGSNAANHGKAFSILTTLKSSAAGKNVYGGYFAPTIDKANNIAVAASLYAAVSPSVSGAGVLTTYAGLYIDAITGALTNNYGLYIAGAASGGATENAAIKVVAGDVVLGGAALNTNSTTGFTYLPGSAGKPTGTPVGHTGTFPLTGDTTNSRLYVYMGSSWLGMGPKLPAARVWSSANQPNDGSITWDSESFDNLGVHTGSSANLVCPEAGVYVALAQVVFNQSPVGQRAVLIAHNGVNRGRTEGYHADGSYTNYWQCHAIDYCDAGDTWSVSVASSATGNVAASGNEISHWFAIFKVSI